MCIKQPITLHMLANCNSNNLLAGIWVIISAAIITATSTQLAQLAKQLAQQAHQLAQVTSRLNVNSVSTQRELNVNSVSTKCQLSVN